jgi:hypothetical protein
MAVVELIMEMLFIVIVALLMIVGLLVAGVVIGGLFLLAMAVGKRALAHLREVVNGS